MRGGDAQEGQTARGIYASVDGVGETTATDRSTRTGDDGADALASARAMAASAAPRRAAASVLALALASARATATSRREAAPRANRWTCVAR